MVAVAYSTLLNALSLFVRTGQGSSDEKLALYTDTIPFKSNSNNKKNEKYQQKEKSVEIFLFCELCWGTYTLHL